MASTPHLSENHATSFRPTPSTGAGRGFQRLFHPGRRSTSLSPTTGSRRGHTHHEALTRPRLPACSARSDRSYEGFAISKPVVLCSVAA